MYSRCICAKGVRVYTAVMPITSTNTFSLATVQHITVDCSALEHDSSAKDELTNILGWIRSRDRRSNIHVSLRFATKSITGRKVRTMFQSLGCTVSMKTDFSRL